MVKAQQPFREEMTQVVRHYIAKGAPRQLDIVPVDRKSCRKASQHTTHPSALLPAFVYADAILRGRHHPRFVRWSQSNANQTRVDLLYVLGAALVAAGSALDVVLILARFSPLLRTACFLLWWPGLSVCFAAAKRMCILLHLRQCRQLRPWEQDYHLDETKPAGGVEVNDDEDDLDSDPAKARNPPGGRQDGAVSQAKSGAAAGHPLRKPTLQTFGPANRPAAEHWTQPYRSRSVLARAVTGTVPLQNQTLQLRQDRTVLLAVLWAGLLAAAMTVGSIFIPGRRIPPL